jgi:protein translocase SecG subunit
MKIALTVIIFLASALLVTSILLQQKGSGLSGVFGGTSASYLTRRGAEKFLTIFTIVIAAVFVIAALSMLILQ